MFDKKVIMITGGTGSFGQHVLEKFLKTNVDQIRIFSRDEKKQEELRLNLRDNRVKFYIGDVRDFDSVYAAAKNVDYVFHAAALKQVPSCEFYPHEAVHTNVLGADNVMRASVARSVRRLIVLSTDKAVYPINAMGLSKAMMEKYMVARSRGQADGETVLCATRYGNVMASRGSVIPLFVSQIKNRLPITITDPNMTRFLMSLDESVDLVLHAYEQARQGDIFVQKAEAATIRDIAEALREIFQEDTPINIIGTRHGEKLYESLVSREEMARAEDMGRFYRIPADTRDLNYNTYVSEGQRSISSHDDYTSHNTVRLNIDQVKNKLIQLDFIKQELATR